MSSFLLRHPHCTVGFFVSLEGFLTDRWVVRQAGSLFVVPYCRAEYGRFEPLAVMVRTLNCFLVSLRSNVAPRDAGFLVFNVSRAFYRERALTFGPLDALYT